MTQPKITQFITDIPSRDTRGNLLYPGRYLQTWVRLAKGVWFLLHQQRL